MTPYEIEIEIEIQIGIGMQIENGMFNDSGRRQIWTRTSRTRESHAKVVLRLDCAATGDTPGARPLWTAPVG
jgi:hypothetical protein